MEATVNSEINHEKLRKEVPQLVSVLKEMKEGLDNITVKVQALTAKVKAKQFPTADGISYLETKHLLLLNYCQSLIYYLLRKARGFPIEGHPVVKSLVEIRLFLEKIRPIDKKLQYQLQKLTRAAASDAVKDDTAEKGADVTTKESEDLLKYRPNPDMLVGKTDSAPQDGSNVYRPPKFAPTTMEDDKMTKLERNARRKQKEILRQVKHNEFVKSLIDDVEDRPEEVREQVGAESRELSRYREKLEERSRIEEEHFTRAPLTKMEKKKMKHLMKSRSGLAGLSESFYDEIKSLPMGDDVEEHTPAGIEDHGRMAGKPKKRKRRHL